VHTLTVARRHEDVYIDRLYVHRSSLLFLCDLFKVEKTLTISSSKDSSFSFPIPTSAVLQTHWSQHKYPFANLLQQNLLELNYRKRKSIRSCCSSLPLHPKIASTSVISTLCLQTWNKQRQSLRQQKRLRASARVHQMNAMKRPCCSGVPKFD
jgi:hypothetical protein